MLDTDFGPISTTAVTSVDASLDGIMLTLAMLTRWRSVINDKISELYNAMGAMDSIKNLMIAQNQQSACDNFRIYVANNGTIVYNENNRSTTPIYGITSGTVIVNGK